MAQEVTERLRKRIEQRVLKAGDRLDEVILAQEFGVSRTPLREALKVLQSEGLVTMTPHRGSFVAELTSADLDDIYQSIAALESCAARAAASNVSQADIEKLKGLQEKMEASALAADYDAYRPVNTAVHSLLHEIAGNKWLMDVVANLRRVLMLYQFVTIWLPERLDQSVAEHRQLLQALIEKNPQEAGRIMEQHVLNQREALRKMQDTAQSRTPQ